MREEENNIEIKEAIKIILLIIKFIAVVVSCNR